MVHNELEDYLEIDLDETWIHHLTVRYSLIRGRSPSLVKTNLDGLMKTSVKDGFLLECYYIGDLTRSLKQDA